MTSFSRRPRGSIMLLVLVFAGIFSTVLTALSGYVLVQNRSEDAARTKVQAFSVAEAGLEYYRWYLEHFPNDLTNGTGDAGPYPVTISAPEGGIAGTASLTITANTSCAQTTSIDISSTGTSTEDPSFPQTLVARYARPSVASYSYIVHDSVWAGADRVINGPYHSNGGIRMDGTSNAPVTSSLSTWICTSNFGCSHNTSEPGVFGAGTDQNLWDYPTPQVNFAGIAADFSSLKTTAQSGGIYLPRYSSGNSGSNAYHKGYHLVFSENGTVTVWHVTSTTKLNVTPVNSSDPSTDYALINNETRDATYTLPASCGLIFIEDNTWIEGTIPSKVTVVVANVSDTGVVPDAFLHGTITYASNGGTSGLTLISEHNILIAPDSPQDMTLDGVFVAQSGAFGRNYYSCSSYPSYSQKGTLTILGSTISYKRTGTQWTGSACGKNYSSGYATRIDSFDRALANNPPPFTPTTSTDFRFVDWRQE
ncbi:MAG: hypothetical protein NUV60_00115 [Patescibacteria group bacterium]|nr:hypothetical protein [Patescibacteria group bacterium]